jgi:hypothetical protein
METNITSHRLRFPNTDSKKIFITASTIAYDDKYLVRMVLELEEQFGMRGWETDTYVYQLKSPKDDPLEIEKTTRSFDPDLILEIYLTDELTTAEYIPNYSSYGPTAAGGRYSRATSSEIELNLMTAADGMPVWQGNVKIKSPNGNLQTKLETADGVSKPVIEIVRAMEKDAVLYKLLPGK